MFIILGILTGLLAFLPYVVALNKSKKITHNSNLGYGALFMLSVFFSFAVLIFCFLFAYFNIRENFLSFTISACICLIICAIGFGIYKNIKK